MKLYIANTTKQQQIFHYRLPEMPEVMRQPPAMQIEIRVGAQEVISQWGNRDLDSDQIKYVIWQLETYGGIDVNELNRLKSYANFIYSVDKMIPPEKIHRVVLLNESAMVQWGKNIRKLSAVADNLLLETGLKNQGLKTGLLQTQISVEEESSESDRFDEKFQVTKYNPVELEEARAGSVFTKKGRRSPPPVTGG